MINSTYLLLCFSSYTLLLVATPLAFGVVKPNGFYGFRTKSTLSNEEIWYRINRIFGRALIISCLIFFVVSYFLCNGQNAASNGINNLLLLLFMAQIAAPVLLGTFCLYRLNREESE